MSAMGLLDEEIDDLRAFLYRVADRLKCLPSIACPSPDEGNSHIIEALDALLSKVEKQNTAALDKWLEEYQYKLDTIEVDELREAWRSALPCGATNTGSTQEDCTTCRKCRCDLQFKGACTSYKRDPWRSQSSSARA